MIGRLDRRSGLRRAVPVVAAGTLAVLALVAWAPPAGAGGRCISLTVDDPVRLPDGSLHAAGDLTLCDWRAVSPVSTLHKTYVNGRPVAMLQGRRTLSEGGDRIVPVVMFARDGDGNLELYGYVLPAQGRSVTYVLNPNRSMLQHAEDPAVAASSPTGPTDTEESLPVVLVAARTR